MTRISRRAALALPFAALARPALAAPLEVTDALGRKVTLKALPERIALNFNFEEYTAVGGVPAWDKVVGFSRELWAGWRAGSFKRYLPVIPKLATLPDFGHTDGGDFSAEKVIALRPDLLLVADWTYQPMKQQMEQFADIDPVAELKAFNDTYLPVAFEGCWMARLTPVGA